MPKFVRVKLPNGSEATVQESLAKRHKLPVLDKPATVRGLPRPAKHKTSVASASVSKKADAGTASAKSTPTGSDVSASSKEDTK